MIRYSCGDPSASCILVQLVDDHDLSLMASEARMIRELAGEDFFLLALKVYNWNKDLTPWNAGAVFGTEDFGDGAGETLTAVLDELKQFGCSKHFYIGGYSLAGLFALWSVFQTDTFSGAACASPSIWYPGFTEYMRTNEIHTGSVYLSLGDREEKTRNKTMSSVGDRIREAQDILHSRGVACTLEWNPGNHFREPDLRTARAFAWVLQNDGNR